MKGGQYIDKKLGRYNNVHSYNDMGENMNENIERSKERTYEVNGNTFTVIREFEKNGTSILEHVISMLIDRMNNSNKESIKEQTN